jgi:hypothetical protein
MLVLPRPVLRWLQELDLSYSIRNVQRDFANGYLVAEIFSRYHPGEICLDSYCAGICEATRRDNWVRLGKVFNRHDLHGVTPTLINQVMNHVEDAAVGLILEMFVHLESAERPLRIEHRSGPPPGYAIPTISAKVKDPELARVVDDDTRRKEVVKTIMQHEADQKRDPRPTSVVPRNPSRNRGRSNELHPIAQEESTKAVEIRHIEIKAFNKTRRNDDHSGISITNECCSDRVGSVLRLMGEVRTFMSPEELFAFFQAEGKNIEFLPRFIDKFSSSLGRRDSNLGMRDLYVLARCLRACTSGDPDGSLWKFFSSLPVDSELQPFIQDLWSNIIVAHG